MTDAQGELDRHRYLDRLERLRPIDDELMRCLFKDCLPLGEAVLRIVLGKPDLVLVEMETQRDLKRLAGARSVELDVWGRDSSGAWHDIEVQRGSSPATSPSYPKATPSV